MQTILVVDDDPAFRQQLQTTLESDGYGVEVAASVRDASAAADRRKFELVICGLRPLDTLQVEHRIAEQSPETPLVIAAAPGAFSAAGDTVRSGAVAFIGKPFGASEEVLLLVRRLMDYSRVAQERDFLREEESARFNRQDFVTREPALLKLLESARQAANSPEPILIIGEIGTGRQLLARCIHEVSPRAPFAFVAVNCAGVSSSVLESEMFGRDKGAPGGASPRRVGRCERAHLGTLLIEEIGALEPGLQGRLMRMLKEGVFERPAGTRQIPADVRLIATTSASLQDLVAQGAFREDLYEQLTRCSLSLPPLRERRGDIPALARLYLCRSGRKVGKSDLALSPAAESALTLYDWPGNVRELENVLERVAMMCSGRVEAADLPIGPTAREKPRLWKDIERQAIEEALRQNNGNRTRAARQLGISLRTLQYRLKEWSMAANA